MNDGSNPPLSNEVLEFHYYDVVQRVPIMQEKVYNECGIYGKQRSHTWMAFIGAGEFLDAPGRETFREVLESLDHVQVISAVGVNWQMHSSNGRLTRANSTFKAYTEYIYDDLENNGDGSDNKHIKSIVRLTNYGRFLNPHRFHLTNDTITVGEHGERMDHFAFRQPITRDRLSLNHYAVKSTEEYQEKMGRGNAGSKPKNWEFWNHVEQMPHVACLDMLRWVRD